MTPRDYINQRKIQKAKALLEAGFGVMDTAMKLSFVTGDYFSVVFKKCTGISPKEWENRCSKSSAVRD